MVWRTERLAQLSNLLNKNIGEKMPISYKDAQKEIWRPQCGHHKIKIIKTRKETIPGAKSNRGRKRRQNVFIGKAEDTDVRHRSA